MTTQQSPRVAEYLTLLAALIMARKEAGGTLPQAEEAAHLGKIDRVWSTMTEDEQSEAEMIAGGRLPAVTGEEDSCPRCGKSWLGEPIPDNQRHYFGSSTHFRRVIAIYDRDLDRTVNFKCPDCGFIFDRA